MEHDPDAMLQQAVYENISDLFAETEGIPTQGALEEECRRMVTVLESSFWMIAREQEVEERYRQDQEGERMKVRVDDREELIAQGVVHAAWYGKRWLVCREGSDDVVEMFDDYRDADNFRMALIEAEEISDEELEAAADTWDRLGREHRGDR